MFQALNVTLVLALGSGYADREGKRSSPRQEWYTSVRPCLRSPVVRAKIILVFSAAGPFHLRDDKFLSLVIHSSRFFSETAVSAG